MSAPDRVLLQVVLTAFAITGFLVLLVMELAILSAGSGDSAAHAFRCLIAPTSKVDTAVHASAIAITVAAAFPVMIAFRVARRARAKVEDLRSATMLARIDSLPPWVIVVAAKAQVLDRIEIVEAPRPFAFAYGWLRPQICLSTGMIALLDEAELEAVLHHEGWHVARRDPLRLLLVQTIGAALGAIPEIRRLVHSCVLAMEVAADDHVVTEMGHPRALASALTKSVLPPTATPAFEGHPEARAAALVGHFPRMPRGRGRLAAVLLLLEIAVFVPLVSNGSIVSIVGLWIHPVC